MAILTSQIRFTLLRMGGTYALVATFADDRLNIKKMSVGFTSIWLWFLPFLHFILFGHLLFIYTDSTLLLLASKWSFYQSFYNLQIVCSVMRHSTYPWKLHPLCSAMQLQVSYNFIVYDPANKKVLCIPWRSSMANMLAIMPGHDSSVLSNIWFKICRLTWSPKNVLLANGLFQLRWRALNGTPTTKIPLWSVVQNCEAPDVLSEVLPLGFVWFSFSLTLPPQAFFIIMPAVLVDVDAARSVLKMVRFRALTSEPPAAVWTRARPLHASPFTHTTKLFALFPTIRPHLTYGLSVLERLLLRFDFYSRLALTFFLISFCLGLGVCVAAGHWVDG